MLRFAAYFTKFFLVVLIATSTITRISSLAPFLPSLTPSTQWDLRLTFNSNGVRSKNGKVPVVRTFVTEGLQFEPLEGYEPPTGGTRTKSNGTKKNGIVDSISYKLSEDPDDQKDGLWIWGLFQDPLYPFCLMEVQTTEFALGDDDCLPPMKLYAKVKHTMKQKEKGGRGKLGSGREVMLEACEIMTRTPVEMKADPAGLAKITLYDEEVVGRIEFLNPRPNDDV
ncbi:hypothetical protein TrST_g11550 [Triparma strigata]|uniref:Uncharacterized protein n=1 Tax=Triparma strigata TaxID=1606541 RepID=A0A9W7F4T7_9STRA|nr:hypothetical protein TrST_g11550 [Triparma strigata]